MEKREELENSVGLLIGDVSRLMRRNFDRRARDLGLTRAQWRVLIHLDRFEGLNQATLADMLEIEPITLVRHLDKLEAAGWLERRPDPHDRRARLLYLQSSAQEMLEKIWELGFKTRNDALTGFTETERAQLVSYLKRLKASLSEKEAIINRECDRKARNDE